MPAAKKSSVSKTVPTPDTSAVASDPAPKKRATKKIQSPDVSASVPVSVAEPTKKRATPSTKSSKIITKQALAVAQQQSIPNIILHLKCSMSDLDEYNNKLRTYLSKPLEYNPDIPPEIESYDNTNMEYAELDSDRNVEKGVNAARLAFPTVSSANVSSLNHFQGNSDVNVTSEYANGTTSSSSSSSGLCACCSEYGGDAGSVAVDAASAKEINHKLKQMKVMLYKNALQEEKKSACFWCTCDFDNAPCRIPKYEIDGTIHGYGSFCRPECGVAYLFREPLDDSTKFARYQLMNEIYGPVYKYKKNIKPAPDPYYLLDKFYGNMSIQEYRKLLKTDHLLLVVDKPLTRVLPELHEDTDETILNVYGINKSASSSTTASGVFKVKRQSEKQNGPSKTSIIRDTFCL